MLEGRRFPANLALFTYSIVTFLLFAAYHFLFPGPAEPLSLYAFSWRFTATIVDFSTFFPAVALSAIVASFGFGGSDMGTEGRRFSPQFLEAMTGPLITVIVAAGLYAALFLFALPASLDARSSMSEEGALFRTAAAMVETEMDAGRWREAARSMATCERIWPNSPETESIRDKLRLGLEELRNAGAEESMPSPGISSMAKGKDMGPAMPGVRPPLDAVEAISLSRKVLAQGHPFDAHWYALLAGRIAKSGSPEAAIASSLAADAWNAVSSTEPSAKDKEAFAIFKRKREGYRAVSGSDWIRAYYIFEELSRTVPNDPDVQNFLAMSEEGARSVAFFADEAASAIGSVETGALFSIPHGQNGGRDVLRARSLNQFEDASYAEGLELLSFAADGILKYRLEAKYAKLMPFTVDTVEESHPVARTALLLLALDRKDPSAKWTPTWHGSGRPDAVETRIILDAAFEDLALASKARRGVEILPLDDLDASAKRLAPFGFVSEAFRAELLRRYSEPFAFLAAAIVALALGWRFRSLRGAGAFGVVMLAVLPFVLNLAVQLFRLVSSTASAAFVLALPFGAAVAAALAFQGMLLIFSLIYLAGQRG